MLLLTRTGPESCPYPPVLHPPGTPRPRSAGDPRTGREGHPCTPGAGCRDRRTRRRRRGGGVVVGAGRGLRRGRRSARVSALQAQHAAEALAGAEPSWPGSAACSSTSGPRPPIVRPPTRRPGELAAGVFAELSTKALEQNNAQFLELADARLMEAQQAAQGDLDQRTPGHRATAHAPGRPARPLRTGAAAARARAPEGLHGAERPGASSWPSPRTVSSPRPATWSPPCVRRPPGAGGVRCSCVGWWRWRACSSTATSTSRCTPRATTGGCVPTWSCTCPGAKQVVVDAKVPLQAFLDATDATDEATRKTHLVSHARQLRAHVDALSKKAYWQQFDDSPEFVVAFIPGDPLLAAALEHDSVAARARRVPPGAAGHPDDPDRAAADRGLRMAAGRAGRERPRGAADRSRALQAAGHLRRAHGPHRAQPQRRGRRLQQGGGLARAQRHAPGPPLPGARGGRVGQGDARARPGRRRGPQPAGARA